MADTSPDAPGDGAATAAPAAAGEGADLAQGLPMFTSADPAALAAERAELVELNAKPTLARWGGFFSKTGPGWLQSAMTLGGGSAAASLFLGATFGYKMLWLQPLAMLVGIIMLSAMSHQTLSTGARPFDAMKRHVTPAVAWAWAIATLASTVIWHFPQYGLAAGMTEDMVGAATGWGLVRARGLCRRTRHLRKLRARRPRPRPRNPLRPSVADRRERRRRSSQRRPARLVGSDRTRGR